MAEFQEPAEVRSTLEQLGIPQVAIVHDAVYRGVLERFACTPFDPPCYPGVVQWARTVRGLREFLVPLRWQSDDTGNFSTVIRPDGLVAIAVSTGDPRTGKAGLPLPLTKYPKGPIVVSAVNRNQLSLLDPTPALTDEDRAAKRATWMLLLVTDQKGKEVRFELSLPNEIGDDDRVRSWADRIIFPPIALDFDLPGDDEPSIPGIDVPVDRL